jgi:hypothetical protein
VAGLTRRLAAAATALAAAVVLASCGGGTNPDALAACKGIKAALADYDASRHATPRRAAALLRDAHHQVARVQEDAALANSADGSYDALMTLVQEAEVMPFHDVADALRAACSAIDAPSYDAG